MQVLLKALQLPVNVTVLLVNYMTPLRIQLSGLSVQLETSSAYWSVEPDTAKKLLDESLIATRNGLDENTPCTKSFASDTR